VAGKTRPTKAIHLFVLRISLRSSRSVYVCRVLGKAGAYAKGGIAMTLHPTCIVDRLKAA
jgi:hypothetical protein